jgi:hypothetical protein
LTRKDSVIQVSQGRLFFIDISLDCGCFGIVFEALL